ncbi:hypothetical protein BDZ85DRAFT_316064 [Elsinoe ampelina]|uniref:chitinase n=1 Tax=Elsinoe ampelina TaxID=302913 RepID=A0A6A6GLP4_9PEZI|nr:hypothetical protein BDZ85DRAFT_316064 [Elsinoe ampelina]
MKLSHIPSFLLPGLVHSAIDLDGNRVVLPVDNGTVPFADPDVYNPEQHACPLPCSDLANIHSWIPYTSVDRLHRCEKPLLLQFSVTVPISDAGNNALIRACSLTGQSDDAARGLQNATGGIPTMLVPVDNPKKAADLFPQDYQLPSACSSRGTSQETTLRYAKFGDVATNVEAIMPLLDGIQAFFEEPDNCDERFVFAYNKGVIAGLAIGDYVGKSSVDSALGAFRNRIQTEGIVTNHTVAEYCASGLSFGNHFGIVLDTTGDDLAAVQRAAVTWHQGACAIQGDLRRGDDIPDVQLFPILSSNTTTHSNSTTSAVGGDSVFGTVGPLTKRAVPVPGSDGVCATHIIKNGDTCDAIARLYGITVASIEQWNKGRTWAWTECKDILVGNSMCISSGYVPLPPAQQGTECGPTVPGTPRPAGGSFSLANLNECPIKACCSNWGFCGVFPAHCNINAPEGGGPGSKLPGAASTCVSNCGVELKVNGPPPPSFGRIGYYESWNFDRECLYLSAKNANTDGTYTHMHWGFADIDPNTWKPIIKDPHNQWNDFKRLPEMKRIVSFGGWAYSTEPATYKIIRSAIIDNYLVFAKNLAQFAANEGIDGIDIDWEYPGATDIFANGVPIGDRFDGIYYFRFLQELKRQMAPGKSTSIAAPASYWYLKNFPIAQIGTVVDYIVYMTYDLHGQWDYGNPNAFDSCPSGKCIRSHVNLTETRNALGMIVKAGVPNYQVFVGEASYGRSFHMARDGCWGPMCDFTGSREISDARPGRCTKTGGYLGYAEITELARTQSGVSTFHDAASNSDIMLYKGDYVSYMTPTTKDTRREYFKGFNFGGSIDWAVDLQAFGPDDSSRPSKRPDTGAEGCIQGEDSTLNTGDLCAFSCSYGVCPESLCFCIETGPVLELPPERSGVDVQAEDGNVPEIERLCKFACKYYDCPTDVCPEVPQWDDLPLQVGEEPNYFDTYEARRKNNEGCIIYEDRRNRQNGALQCYNFCKDIVEEAKSQDLITNYGCLGWWPNAPGNQIPWVSEPTIRGRVADGKCICDSWLINELASAFLEAIPIIAQIGCYAIMSALKLVLDIGLEFIPGPGKVLDAGLEMATTAAQLAAYAYDGDNDPQGAFEWWLSPCGDTSLVPAEMRQVFDILSSVADGVTRFKPPQNIKKGSGKKGDRGNPTDRSKKRSEKDNSSGNGSGNNNGGTDKKKPKKKCTVRPGQSTRRMGGGHTLRRQSCKDETLHATDMIITSLGWPANAEPTAIGHSCRPKWSQACWHYSSAASVNPHWKTLDCPVDAATTSMADRVPAGATSTWSWQHNGQGWTPKPHPLRCQRDEWPPAMLLYQGFEALEQSGKNSKGQLVRYIEGGMNEGAGSYLRGKCFHPMFDTNAMSNDDFTKMVNAVPANKRVTAQQKDDVKQHLTTQTFVAVTMSKRPQFYWSSYPQAPANAGLNINRCWPSDLAPKDPGFALLTYDPYYGGQAPPYNYRGPAPQPAAPQPAGV